LHPITTEGFKVHEQTTEALKVYPQTTEGFKGHPQKTEAFEFSRNVNKLIRQSLEGHSDT
jgi:hypothetical protein